MFVTLLKLKEFKTKLKYAHACHLCLHSSERSIDRSVQLSDGTDGMDPGLVSGVVNPGKGSEFWVPLTSLEA